MTTSSSTEVRTCSEASNNVRIQDWRSYLKATILIHKFIVHILYDMGVQNDGSLSPSGLFDLEYLWLFHTVDKI